MGGWGVEGEEHPDEYHSAIQQFFFVYFESLKRQLGVRVRPDLRVQVAARNFRIPDVTLLRAEAPFVRVASEAPLLCIEVMPEDDREDELLEKVADYVGDGRGGDLNRRSSEADDGDGGCAGLHVVEVFQLPGTSVRITAAELFAEVEELESRTS